MENPFNQTNDIPKRPTFLLVLCILSFIGSGWGVLSSLFNILMNNTEIVEMQIEQVNNAAANLQNAGASMQALITSSVETLASTAGHIQEIYTMALVLGLLSLTGAILMYNLRRVGFYLYTVAQILTLFIVPCYTGFSMLIVMTLVINLIPTIVFIILYAINLKHMH